MARRIALAYLLALSAVFGATQTAQAQQTRAFPTAEGFGMYASGGRGGKVVYVENLKDSGAGSLRAALTATNSNDTEPRIVVFKVGGVIRITSPIWVRSNVTIAGQTAPGDGITVYGGSMIYSQRQNIITRHIRYRMGRVGSGSDAVSITSGKKMIFDHVSTSWGQDGVFDVNTNYHAGRFIDSITIQNSILAQNLSGGKGMLWQTREKGHLSSIRNVMANIWTRNPKVCYNLQFVNNVVYNWGASGMHIDGVGIPTESNIEGNYFINGPGSTRPGIVGGDSMKTAYMKDNWWDSNRNGVLDGKQYGVDVAPTYNAKMMQASKPFAYPAISKTLPAAEAYKFALTNAGANLKRDQVDALLLAEVMSLGPKGTFLSHEDSLPTKGPGIVKGGTAPTDTDVDGMPDAWELAHGLNPKNASDGNATTLSDWGYTNVEMYLNEKAGDPVVYKGQGALTTSIVSAESMIGKLTFTPVFPNGIQKVEFWKNGVLECTDVARPYECLDTVNVASTYPYEARVFIGGVVAYRTTTSLVMPFAYGLRAVRSPNELFALFNLPKTFVKGTALTIKVTSGNGTVTSQTYTAGVPGTQSVKFGVKFAKKNTGNFAIQLLNGKTSLATGSFSLVN